MAWTVTYTKGVMGNQRTTELTVVTDGAEATIDTGLHFVRAMSFGIKSITSSDFTIFTNKGSTSTALNGYLGCSGFTSGDSFDIIVYGT